MCPNDPNAIGVHWNNGKCNYKGVPDDADHDPNDVQGSIKPHHITLLFTSDRKRPSIQVESHLLVGEKMSLERPKSPYFCFDTCRNAKGCVAASMRGGGKENGPGECYFFSSVTGVSKKTGYRSSVFGVCSRSLEAFD